MKQGEHIVAIQFPCSDEKIIRHGSPEQHIFFPIQWPEGASSPKAKQTAKFPQRSITFLSCLFILTSLLLLAVFTRRFQFSCIRTRFERTTEFRFGLDTQEVASDIVLPNAAQVADGESSLEFQVIWSHTAQAQTDSGHDRESLNFIRKILSELYTEMFGDVANAGLHVSQKPTYSTVRIVNTLEVPNADVIDPSSFIEPDTVHGQMSASADAGADETDSRVSAFTTLAHSIGKDCNQLIRRLGDAKFIKSGWTKAVFEVHPRTDTEAEQAGNAARENSSSTNSRAAGAKRALKVLNNVGRDVYTCAEQYSLSDPMRPGQFLECYSVLVKKLLKEIILLSLFHNSVQLYDYCVNVPGLKWVLESASTPALLDERLTALRASSADAAKDGFSSLIRSSPVFMLVQLGEPVSQLATLQLSWQQRLLMASGAASFLSECAHSSSNKKSPTVFEPCGMTDLHESQFVLTPPSKTSLLVQKKGSPSIIIPSPSTSAVAPLVSGLLFLRVSDLDDLSLHEPRCTTDADCEAMALADPRLGIFDNNSSTASPSRILGLRCLHEGRCAGFNELLNVQQLGNFVRYLLHLEWGAPPDMQGAVMALFESFTNASRGTFDIEVLNQQVQRASRIANPLDQTSGFGSLQHVQPSALLDIEHTPMHRPDLLSRSTSNSSPSLAISKALSSLVHRSLMLSRTS